AAEKFVMLPTTVERKGLPFFLFLNLIQLKHVICLQIFSLVAVVCEELVQECYNCSPLYYFEFASCSAFLLSLLFLYVYCTDLYESLGEDKVRKLVRKLFFWKNKQFLLSHIFLSFSQVFGFFATSVFVAELVIEIYLRIKQKRNAKKHSEKPPNAPSATENQPLNKKR
uniref:Uncharacterized protein n=1 Tax=Zonotrichia albicollis TaxID=44394 RepID=A0A8D2M126_ZONAL